VMLLKKSSIATGNATYRFAYHGDDVAVNQYDDDAFGNTPLKKNEAAGVVCVGPHWGRNGESRNDTGRRNRLLRSE
jgi:hypothetical protein